MDLTGKTFIVTGAGSGLGEGVACVFAEAGANIVVADLAADNGRRVAQTLGKNALFTMCDVANESSAAEAVSAALDAFGGLNGAINCAGISAANRVCTKQGPHPLDMFRRILEINLLGTFNVIRLAADAMSRLEPGPDGERGVFINTASVAAFDGQIGQAAYAASKGGVAAMTLPLARDLARLGIRVVTIAPGVFDTPMLAALPGEVRHALEAQVPFPPRFGTPREFGKLARHIAENPMINGETIRLDGGLRMPPK